MLVYRICRDIYHSLDGEGARLFGGRWNGSGHSVVYASEHISLCVLEQLVHLDVDLIPNNWIVVTIEIPDKCLGEKVDALPETTTAMRQFGDLWVSEKRSLLLVVPSVVVPQENNILINPHHPEMKGVKVKNISPFKLDWRLPGKKEGR